MKNDLKDLLSQLNNLNYELLDPSTALAETDHEAPWFSNRFSVQLSWEDLDRFDTLNFKLPRSFKPSHSSARQSFNWREAAQFMEACLSNGITWGFDQEDYEVNPETYQSLFNSAIEHLQAQQPAQSCEEILAEFDSWAGTPLDIMSIYGDADFGNNLFADRFEVNVPVSIRSEKEDVVVKANIPWVKFNGFKNVDLYPSEMNLKTVLSLLPVRVNSQQMRVSFVDGEFRLEMPRAEEASQKKEAL